MNDKQKILVMVGAGSLFVLLISLFNSDMYSLDNPFSFLYLKPISGGFEQVYHTNYLGIIGSFNVVVAIVGFFLFKDE